MAQLALLPDLLAAPSANGVTPGLRAVVSQPATSQPPAGAGLIRSTPAPETPLDPLLREGRVWRGQRRLRPESAQCTGLAELDEMLPFGGWPAAALTELLLPADGVGELRLLLPTLARLTGAGMAVALVAPPYLPFPAAWLAAGIDLAYLHLIDAEPRDAWWAAEQCLRSGALAAVLCWPRGNDDRLLRRLQVAAETGQALGFAFRDRRAAANPSPAALRLLLEAHPGQLRVLKCRGGLAPAAPLPLPCALH